MSFLPPSSFQSVGPQNGPGVCGGHCPSPFPPLPFHLSAGQPKARPALGEKGEGGRGRGKDAHVAQNAVQPSPLPGGSPHAWVCWVRGGGGSQASCMRQKLGTFGHCGGTQGTDWDPMGPPPCLAPECIKWVVPRMTHWGSLGPPWGPPFFWLQKVLWG